MPNASNSAQIYNSGQVANGVITSGAVLDGTIMNIDVNAAAAIDQSKLANAAKSGANSDITSLASLSTPLSVAQGGSGVNTLTVHGVLIGNAANAFNATGAGVAGQLLTSNGPGADPTFQSPSAALILLYAGNGTDNTAAAHDMFTLAITGLTALDSLLFHITFSEITQTVAAVSLYSITDSKIIHKLNGGSTLIAARTIITEVMMMNAQEALTTYNTIDKTSGALVTANDSQDVAGFVGSTPANMTTNWTGNWTLSLRTGAAGVTAGGTFRWKCKIYKVLGQ